MKTYLATQLFDGTHMHNDVHMCVDKGQITAIQAASQSPFQTDIHLNGTVCAGFIDVQVNGGGGLLFNHQQSSAALQQIMYGHSKYGTTAMLPTLITDSNTKMRHAANAVSEALASNMPGIVGIHFEGPHLSLAKKGIHSKDEVRPISDSDLAIITRQDIGKVMVTLAPENVSPSVIKELVKQKVVVSLGHSAASIDTTLRAIEAGALCFTHLFNAMSGLSAREPGMITAALSDKRVYAGIIADLEHVHPQNCRLAYQCLGPNRLMLVTDAMAHVGSEITTLPWLDATITKHGHKLTLDDGSLAGSCLDMAGAVQNMYKVIVDDSSNEEKTLTQNKSALLGDVLNMASRTPAKAIGLHDRGQLKQGFQADFVLLNDALQVQACWINGQQVAGAQR